MDTDYKEWYLQAIEAANKLGFGCMSAGAVIEAQGAEITTLKAEVAVQSEGWQRANARALESRLQVGTLNESQTKLLSLIQTVYETLDPHRDAVLWGQIWEVLKEYQ